MFWLVVKLSSFATIRALTLAIGLVEGVPPTELVSMGSAGAHSTSTLTVAVAECVPVESVSVYVNTSGPQ